MGCGRTRKDRLDTPAHKTAITKYQALSSNELIQEAPARVTIRTLFTKLNRTPKKMPVRPLTRISLSGMTIESENRIFVAVGASFIK
jgi:hypothetical protein